MAGYDVADIAALQAVDITANPTPAMRFVVAKNQWYRYDPADTLAGNGEWIVAPSAGAGRWHPTGRITGTTTPTGASNYPVTYLYVAAASGGGNLVDFIYQNPGGGSSLWTRFDWATFA